MCSSPHWQVEVGSSWFREKLSPANRNKGYPGDQISRKISPANWMQGVTAISRKISRSWAPRLQNSRNRWAKKWGPTCDRDISNSAIYTTAIYRAYTVLLMRGTLCNYGSNVRYHSITINSSLKCCSIIHGCIYSMVTLLPARCSHISQV